MQAWVKYDTDSGRVEVVDQEGDVLQVLCVSEIWHRDFGPFILPDAHEQPLPDASAGDGQESVQDAVIRDIEERKRIGLERYGSLLYPNNGRDGLQDLYEELIDGAMYVRQVLMERNGGG